ncbi:MAG: glycosyltransferase family 39 protein [Candidatus Latescibacteria bacterium]|jgi:asparagine N-glycosylation enzyme membrane subunit Stt3|nr:glycosyltransferase family 39 protein [Candidatus Latescibacterota bacterium]
MKSLFDTIFDCNGESGIWPRLWQVLLWGYGVVIFLTFHEYGVTSDEHHHVKYGADIFHWYFSLFQNHTVFQSVNTWLYGGFFDLTAYLLAYALPLDIYDTRHLYCAVIGLLGVVAAYRIGCLFGGPRAGFVAALCLVLTPRYYGHTFNNTKDIPFAVFYLWSVYYLIAGLGKLPHLSRRDCVKMGVAIGLTMAIRSSGVVLFFYLGVCLVLWTVWQRRSEGKVDVFGLVKQVGLVVLVSYVVLLPFWPWMQLHPLTGLWDGVLLFASFGEVHYSFFEGSYVASDGIGWYYAPKWLLLTLPEFVLVGCVLGVGCWVVCPSCEG